MALIGTLLAQVRQLDRLGRSETPIHRLDARAKLLATLAFVVCVASFDRYAVASLLPLAVFPVALAIIGRLPLSCVASQVAVAAPFALLVGLANPFFDRQVVFAIGPLALTGGWLSWASISVRALLTLSAAVILVGVTSFPALCTALQRLGLPRPLVAQLRFLHRYLFVLIDEVERSVRAVTLRSAGRGVALTTASSLIGLLLLRTWERAERVQMAMLSRCYAGEPAIADGRRLAIRELVFVAGWLGFFGVVRRYDLPELLGSLTRRVLA
ncbi:cobalt ECF transporter T component CbiQ [Accumulibacter sp.]|uniref:cobalt ECF transporter T component CbiQ n=1 Tax=Accumulibacter sp. TaxID=2053492 RepID=UPI0025FA94DA|nr:cobalt ECF transporter T component CbiQ [Accumulibacter sp.]MCM8593872.1 cobalt ECF transporter T component CbiQ [Accumulibacter sp.]MCM8626086.1 cobalt ECF transporter T component CbiQ [Accumulibacter sp.]MDS4048013.1 cobalt ECF transporter T component CbiQ [Accumulibacter sp.]